MFEDLMAYVCLFLSMRGGDWRLGIAGIKKMAATFTDFDHPHYVKQSPDISMIYYVCYNLCLQCSNKGLLLSALVVKLGISGN